MHKALIPILLLAAGASTAAPPSERAAREEAQFAKKLDGLTPGPAQSCITPSRSQGGVRYRDQQLIQDRFGKLYLTRFQPGCIVRDSDALISRRPGERLCRGDIVEARDMLSGMSSGACVYGDFVPYSRPKG